MVKDSKDLIVEEDREVKVVHCHRAHLRAVHNPETPGNK